MGDEKAKQDVKSEGEQHVNLKVAGQDGSIVQFKIKRHTPLKKLMQAYCDRQVGSGKMMIFGFLVMALCPSNEYIIRLTNHKLSSVVQTYPNLGKLHCIICTNTQGLILSTIRFRFDGESIDEGNTPNELQMENEDTIDVFTQQTGGTIQLL